MVINAANTSYNYVFKTQGNGNPPPNRLIFFEVQGPVRSVSSGSVSGSAAIDVYSPNTITATLDGNISAGQGVYVRYTDDNFATSTVAEMAVSGTTCTFDIPASFHTTAKTVRYYVFTSGDGMTITGAKADWYTINLINNGGSNYSYTVTDYNLVKSNVNNFGYAGLWKMNTSGSYQIYGREFTEASATATFNFYKPATSWGTGAAITVNSPITSMTSGGGNMSFAFTQNKYYLFRWNATNEGIVMEFDNSPATITGVSGPTGTGQALGAKTVTVNLTAAPDASQVVYVAYRVNGGSFTLGTATPSGSSATFDIPAQEPGSTVDYYAFTSVAGATVANQNAMAFSLNNNGGSNYSYSLTSTQEIKATQNNFGIDATWQLTATGVGSILGYTRQFTEASGSTNFRFHKPTQDYGTGAAITLGSKITGMTAGGANMSFSHTQDKFYVFRWNGTDQGYVMQFDQAPISITGVSGPTGSVGRGAREVTVSLSGTPDANERVYLRYTTDNWSTSTLVETDPSSASVVVSVPDKSAGTTVRYYVFTSVPGVAVADSDLATISFNTNGGSNYSYTVQDFYEVRGSFNGFGSTMWQMNTGWAGHYQHVGQITAASGTSQFYFQNGASSFGAGASVSFGTKVTAIGALGTNMSFNHSQNKHYLFRWNPTAQEALVYEFSSAPVTITGVANPANSSDPAAKNIVISLSGNAPAEQRVYLRYTTDNEATWTQVELNPAGASSVTYSVGPFTQETTFEYYVYTSGAGLAEADRDLGTFSGNNNGGANYTLIVRPREVRGEFNNFLTGSLMVQGREDSYLFTRQFATADDGDSNGKQRFKFYNLGTWQANGNASIAMGSRQTNLISPGGDMEFSMTNGKWYTFKWRESQSTFMVMDWSQQPVGIASVTNPGPSVTNGAQTVTVQLTGNADANERVFLRYTDDNWSTSTLLIQDPAGASSVNFTLPGRCYNTTIKYNVFTSHMGYTGAPVVDDWLASVAYTADYQYTVNVAAPTDVVVDGATTGCEEWLPTTSQVSATSTAGSHTLDIIWNNDYFYFLLGSGFSSGQVVNIAVDNNPGTTGTPATWNGASFPPLYTPEHYFTFENLGTGQWTELKVGATIADLSAVSGSATSFLEIQIPKTAIGSSAPVGFHVWISNAGSFVSAYPPGNTNVGGVLHTQIGFADASSGGVPAEDKRYDAQITQPQTLVGHNVFNNLTFSADATTHNYGGGSPAYENNHDILVKGDFTVETGAILTLDGDNGNDIWVEGDLDIQGGLSGNRALFLSGSEDQNMDVPEIGFLVIQKTGGKALMLGNLDINGTGSEVLTLAGGDLDLNGNVLTMSGNGELAVKNGPHQIIDSQASGKIDFANSNNTVAAYGAGRLEVAASATIEIGGGANLNFGLDGGTRVTTINGRVLVTGTPGTITNYPIYGPTSVLEYQNLVGINSGGEWPASGERPSNIIINCSPASVTLNENKAIKDTITFTSGELLAGAGPYSLSYVSTGVLKYNGTSGAQTTTDFEFPASGTANVYIDNEVNLNGPKSVGGTLTTTSGNTLDVTAGNFALDFEGNVVNNGAINLRSNTATFDGTANQTVTGNALAFHNLVSENGAGNQVLLDMDGVTTVTSAMTINNGVLALAGGSSMTLETGATAHLNAGTTCFVLKSENDDARRVASFLPKGTINNPEHARMEFTTAVNRYFMISPAVIGATAAVMDMSAPNTRLYTWNEPGGNWAAVPDNSTALTPGRGYFYKDVATVKTLNFNGPFNTADVSAAGLTQTPNIYKHGYNMVGNPYPSYLDWGSEVAPTGCTMTQTYSTIWFYDNGAYATYNQAGSGVGAGGGTRLVPPMQGFWIRVSPVHPTGSIDIAPAARTHGTGEFFKASSPDQILRLAIEGNGFSRDAVVRFSQNAASGFDTYDSEIFTSGNARMAELYTSAAGASVIINSYPDMAAAGTVPMGIIVGTAGTYSLRVLEMTNIPSSAFVFLEDLQTGDMIDLRQRPVVSLQLARGTIDSRFLLHFFPPTTTEVETVETGISIGTEGSWISIQTEGQEGIDARLFDLTGKQLESLRSPASAELWQTTAATGIYILEVRSGESILRQKVFLNR